MDQIRRYATLLVVVGGIAALGFAVHKGADKDTIAALGAALVALAGAMKSFLGDAKKDGAK